MTRSAIVVVAAGAGTRLGLDLPKALAPYRGSTLLGGALRHIRAISRQVDVVVVAPESHRSEVVAIVDGAFAGSGWHVDVVVGGATRQQSVNRGLAAVAESASIILVHDAARADAPATLFESVIAHVEATGRGALPALAVVDSLTRVDAQSRLHPVDRDGLYAVQTPQGFPADALRAAHAQADPDVSYTDDASLVTAAGYPVDIVAGDAAATKVTYPDDLAVGHDAGARQASEPVPVTGIGVDIHQFGDGGTLRVAGVDWPDEPALVGHSDGDVVLHAICDALLSAAQLGDLGTHFGSSRPEYAGAESIVFVRDTLRLVADAGATPLSVSVQLVGERPKVGDRRAAVEAHLSAIVGVPVSFAATTTDKLGFLGHPDGIAAVATATIVRRTAS